MLENNNNNNLQYRQGIWLCYYQKLCSFQREACVDNKYIIYLRNSEAATRYINGQTGCERYGH